MVKRKDIDEVRGIGRRDFLKLTGVGTLALMSGCAKNPVTGESEFMLMSEADEIAQDQEAAPRQFSMDYGAIQDKALNDYVIEVGTNLAKETHRPHMPYNYRCLNAIYVNAYTFAGGSMAVTRALLLKMENEAELAGVLGHEIGHVNARHTSSRSSRAQGLLTLLGLGATMAEAYTPGTGDIVLQAGGLGTQLVLNSYSRDDERQADDLGMLYMTKCGYNPQGVVGLQEMLLTLSPESTNILDVMMSTHPLNSERVANARAAAAGKYADSSENKFYRERFMDKTASLRKSAPVVNALQDGFNAECKGLTGQAEQCYRGALKKDPTDYAALLMLSKSCLQQERSREAVKYALRAREVYPEEPQGLYVAGLSQLRAGDYAESLANLKRYQGHIFYPPTMFLKGVAKENLGRIHEAADEYFGYLRYVTQGHEAQYAYSRLVHWGYIRSQIQVPAGDPLQALKA